MDVQILPQVIHDWAYAGLAWVGFGTLVGLAAKAVMPGRDHWPQVSCCLMAGGGLRTGQVIGATNRLGEYAAQRPVHPGEVIATAYHTLGIRPETSINDQTGRPQHVIDKPVMRELV